MTEKPALAAAIAAFASSAVARAKSPTTASVLDGLTSGYGLATDPSSADVVLVNFLFHCTFAFEHGRRGSSRFG